jgi:hypothetical protein
MKITIKIEGVLQSPTEEIELEIEAPDDWHPGLREVLVAKGAIREGADRLQQHFDRRAPEN